ncbi:hypothetical protein [uncultured Dysosmobacter sp.]|uniref:hypothetical protein n=1 Tax=uncultured Dysosmobacter sp. TaxID=2591384 RepID=UPI00261E380E|nr:hypothetical protein [uncultured Dysosmobacter sp.]
MDNYSIKSVTFGGFDKQDVIQYIERTAKEAAENQKKLLEENDGLREKMAAAEQEISALRMQVEELSAQRDTLQAKLQQEAFARQALEPLKPLEAEVARLSAEADALRPDAEAYAQFRERIGAIECEARKRAADLEAATAVQLQRTLDLFRGQYQVLMDTFESTAAHVNGELRKVEVNLTQLPRAMDQAGAELNQLSAVLERTAGGEN